jgi:hypothetical protein
MDPRVGRIEYWTTKSTYGDTYRYFLYINILEHYNLSRAQQLGVAKVLKYDIGSEVGESCCGEARSSRGIHTVRVSHTSRQDTTRITTRRDDMAQGVWMVYDERTRDH